jgi:uncharacterized membrane protein
LPRYFVYHQEAAPDSPENAIWTDRERKLLRIIMWPSMVMSGRWDWLAYSMALLRKLGST